MFIYLLLFSIWNSGRLLSFPCSNPSFPMLYIYLLIVCLHCLDGNSMRQWLCGFGQYHTQRAEGNISQNRCSINADHIYDGLSPRSSSLQVIRYCHRFYPYPLRAPWGVWKSRHWNHSQQREPALQLRVSDLLMVATFLIHHHGMPPNQNPLHFQPPPGHHAPSQASGPPLSPSLCVKICLRCTYKPSWFSFSHHIEKCLAAFHQLFSVSVIPISAFS